MTAYDKYVSYVNETNPGVILMPKTQKKFTSMVNEIAGDFQMVYKRNIGGNKPGYIGRELKPYK